MAQSSIASPLLVHDSDAPSSSRTEVPVDVNTASPELLRKRVPKIGSILANRIVEYREQNGRFGSADDLVKVPGIGRRLAESLFPPYPGVRAQLDMAPSGVMAHHTLEPPWGAPSADMVHEEKPMNSLQSDEVLGAPESGPAPTHPLKVAVLTGSVPVKVASILLAVVVGLGIGVWQTVQSTKLPVRDLNERVDNVRVEQERTRADLEARTSELRAAQAEVKALTARVDQEATERKADHERVSHDVAALHDTVRKSNASTEARIQRVRDALTMIELYQGANLSPSTPAKSRPR